MNDMNQIIEELSSKVHDSWWSEKLKQGFHAPLDCPEKSQRNAQDEADYLKHHKWSKHCEWCHVDMYPYEELAEHTKEYDRATVRAVIKALAESTNVL